MLSDLGCGTGQPGPMSLGVPVAVGSGCALDSRRPCGQVCPLRPAQETLDACRSFRTKTRWFATLSHAVFEPAVGGLNPSL